VVLYEFCLLPGWFCYIIINVWYTECLMQFTDRCPPWKIVSGAENIVLQALILNISPFLDLVAVPLTVAYYNIRPHAVPCGERSLNSINPAVCTCYNYCQSLAETLVTHHHLEEGTQLSHIFTLQGTCMGRKSDHRKQTPNRPLWIINRNHFLAIYNIYNIHRSSIILHPSFVLPSICP
jgi:hypothetical protein